MGRVLEKANETLRAYVRLAPNSGARADIPGPPLWATSGLMHSSKKRLFDHLVGAAEGGARDLVGSEGRLAILRKIVEEVGGF